MYEDRRARLALSIEEKEKLMQDVYYGFITDKVTPRSAKVFQRIIALRSMCGRHPVSGGIRLNLRVYHRQDDFMGYQVASLRSLKRSFSFKNL